MAISTATSRGLSRKNAAATHLLTKVWGDRPSQSESTMAMSCAAANPSLIWLGKPDLSEKKNSRS